MGKPMADAVQSCVHCGFCLSACPTYQVMGQEMDSPRGRILSMRHVLEGTLELEEVLPHTDACLGCLACETACPSGVVYRELISPFREYANAKRKRPLIERLKRMMILSTLPYPKRFRLAATTGKLARPFKALVPKPLQPMIDLLPQSLPKAVTLPTVTPAQGKQRGRVALLAGCAQQVLDPDINLATIDVLSRNGIEVIVPEKQACCGALAWHIGEGDAARATGRKNLEAFDLDTIDAVISNAAGCGSGLQEYHLIFRGRPEETQADALAKKTKDVNQYLYDLGGLIDPPSLPNKVKVAYHDACHMLHGQKVQAAPRTLLRQVGNLEVVDIPDSHLCCGSAGTYNIDQPDVARELGRRKAASIQSTTPDLVATGNIGCMVQIKTHVDETPRPLPILHTMQILARAYRGDAVV